jgi:hypothetical protein
MSRSARARRGGAADGGTRPRWTSRALACIWLDTSTWDDLVL